MPKGQRKQPNKESLKPDPKQDDLKLEDIQNEESKELGLPPGTVLVSSEWLKELMNNSGSSMNEIEKDIIDEAVRLAKNETTSAYQLVQYAKELIAQRRGVAN